MKKFISLFLTIVILASITGCRNSGEIHSNGERDFEIGDTGGLKVPFGKGEEIEVMCTDEGGIENTYIFDKLSQVLGVNIKPIFIPKSSYNEKVSAIFASASLPDILSCENLVKTNDYAMQGAFEPITPYMKDLPNISRYFGENGKYSWVTKSYAAPDGELYVLPEVDSNRLVNHGMLYRKDIFDKHGIEMWNSPETFYQALKKLKEIYPDSYPLTSKTGAQILKNYGVAWGGLNIFNVYYDEDSSLWKYSDTDPKTKSMLDYFHKLFKEGLLDPEFLTNTQPAWTNKMTTGKSFVTYDWIGRLDMFTTQSVIPGYDLRYANPVGPSQTLITLEQVNKNGLSVAKGKNSLLAMKVVDFWYSQAGAELMTLGVRGQTFDIDENGNVIYTDEELRNKEKIEISDLTSKYCMWVAGSYRVTDKRSCYYQYTEREKEAQDWVEKCKGLEPSDPVVLFSKNNDVSKSADLITGLSKKFEEVMFKYIIGQETGDAAWEKWLKEAEKLGEKELCELYNNRHKELGL